MRWNVPAVVRFILTFAMGLVLGAGAMWAYLSQKPQNQIVHHSPPLRELVENSYSEHTNGELAYEWRDCLERFQSSEDAVEPGKILCNSWTVQGVTSTLFALQIGDERVPVVESHLANSSDTGLVIIHIEGGPGGEPFHVDRRLTEEFLERLRGKGFIHKGQSAIMKDRPEYQLVKRGFTIASVGYWGMSIRTFDQAGEFDLAVNDVRLAIEHYRAKLGEAPPMYTISLGNHLAFGALGKDRLEKTRILALVPVMDGLQHHIQRVERKSDKEQEKAEKEGRFFGEWARFNIYLRDEGVPTFDHSRMLRQDEYVPQFVGDADYAWRDVVPTAPCSRIVLGTQDWRTEAYLNSREEYPPFVEVWDSGHNIFKDAPEQSNALFADFAECLIAQGG